MWCITSGVCAVILAFGLQTRTEVSLGLPSAWHVVGVLYQFAGNMPSTGEELGEGPVGRNTMAANGEFPGQNSWVKCLVLGPLDGT